MRARLVIPALLGLLSTALLAQDNPVLQKLFAEDQAARRQDNINWEILHQEDEVRRQTVLEILKAGGVTTAKDYYHAGLVFQHALTADDIRLAHAFATIAAALDGGSRQANSLKAVSWDRLLRYLGQAQWYGTQYVKDESGHWVLDDMAPGIVTDDQRKAWSVPTLEEARARVKVMNGESQDDP